MRKHLLFLLLTALCCNGLFAQDCEDDRPYRIAIGPKVGLGMDMGSHSKLENLDFQMGLGYQFGGAFHAHFGRRSELSCGGTGLLGVQIEAMYGGRSVKLDDATLTTNCIEVPMLAQLYFTPNVAMLAGVTAVKIVGTTPSQLHYQGATYGTGVIKGGDVMITAGLAYKTSINESSSLMIDARYNLGMSPLAGNFDTKISSMMLSFAYLFNIVK